MSTCGFLPYSQWSFDEPSDLGSSNGPDTESYSGSASDSDGSSGSSGYEDSLYPNDLGFYQDACLPDIDEEEDDYSDDAGYSDEGDEGIEGLDVAENGDAAAKDDSEDEDAEEEQEEETAVPSKDALRKLRVSELRRLCEKLELPKSGKKAVLVDRVAGACGIEE